MESILSFLLNHGVEIGVVAGLIAILEFALKPFRLFFGLFAKPQQVRLDKETIDQIAPEGKKDGPKLTTADFIRIRREFKDELWEEFQKTQGSEQDKLLARIAELEKQIADPEKSLAEERKRIEELELLLERSSNQIGSERIDEARVALERGDYSIADDIFAEIEAARELEVLEAARAAFGRGEIAEAEIRWSDAAKHYARAADLDGSYENLSKAQDFTERAGDYQQSESFGNSLLRVAERLGDPQKRAKALNLQALTIRASGRPKEAEALLREAIDIDKRTLGQQHPEYSKHLNNLAGALWDQGRIEEAEKLLVEAIEVDRSTIGEDDPEFAKRIGNLAAAFESQGRLKEAELHCREAIAIAKKADRENHPDYATYCNNLARVLQAQSKFKEAEKNFDKALRVAKNELGSDHPNTKKILKNLESLLKQMEDDG